ncbi:uncharacterized protein LOC123702180 [Colias croceus]|uniref:uncharacterized protein LOC123702180 n=1 Tax=Colias crocea TaxID=72248 RepID=UPI001E27C82E|nr:uncharacterized protein LOC123702180 [Colias croceus]
MILCIRKKIKQPVAYYLSGDHVTADRLMILIKEVLHACFHAGIIIAATVCDMDGVNRRALTQLGASVEQPYFKFEEHEIVALYDTPHLLKCFRNLFLKYNIKCSSNVECNGRQIADIAKWNHIEEFFVLDNNNPFFVFAPALTKSHLSPNNKQKMKVKLAAQVLSHTVSAGMYAKITLGELPTEALATVNLLNKIDQLFDSLNADSPSLKRGKKYLRNISDRSPHFAYFKEMKLFFKNCQFIGAKSRAPSLDGWIQTMAGVERIWRNLKLK